MIHKLDECGIHPYQIENKYRKYDYYYAVAAFNVIADIIVSHIWTSPIRFEYVENKGGLLISFIE